MNESSAARKFKFLQAVVSDVGLKREENQDSYGYAHTDRVTFYIVADGMGGARGGGTASALAVEVVLRNSFDENGLITEASLKEALEMANEVIFERSKGDPTLTGMGTTIVTLAFIEEHVIVGHVGDSRIYQLRNGTLKQLTRDHTLVQELVDSGAIKPEDAAHHPIAHMLTRSLGPTGTVQPEIAVLPEPLQAGDRFLLCSDGMYNLVTDPEIETLLRDCKPEDAVQRLLELVLERGASDNTTIEIIEARTLDDESIEISVPEPGKIRLVTSGELFDDLAPEPMESASSEAAEGGDEPEPDLLGASEPTSSTPPPPKADEPSAATSRHDETLEEFNAEVVDEHGPTPEELRDLKRIQNYSIGIILFTLTVLGFVFFGSGRRTEVASVQRPQILPTAAPTLVTRLSTPSPTVEPSAVPSEEPTAVAPGSQNGTEPSITPIPPEGPTEAPAPGAPKVAAWPQLSVVAPGATGSNSVPSATAEASVSPTAVSTPAPGTTVLSKYSEILDVALTSAVSPVVEDSQPKSADGGHQVAPIDWAKEELAKQKLSQNAPDIIGSGSLILTEAEMGEVARRKSDLREGILDLDVKIRALRSVDQATLDALHNELSGQLSVAQKAFDEIRTELTAANSSLGLWTERKRTLGERAASRLAEELADSDPEIKSRKADFDSIVLKYRQSVAAWQADPQNMARVSEMGAVGREQKLKLDALEEAVHNVVDRGYQEATSNMSRLNFAFDQIGRYLQRLSRHIGLVRGSQADIGGQNTVLISRNIQDRNQMMAEFSKLTSRLSDYAEREYQASRFQKAP